MDRYSYGFLTALAVTAAAACPAGADYMEYDGLGRKQAVRVTVEGTGVDYDNVYAGELRVSYLGQDYRAYCVDIFQHVGSDEVSELSILDLDNGRSVAWLFDTYASQVDSDLEAAALGLSIWEVLYEDEGAWDLTTGGFWADRNSSAINLANDWLALVDTEYDPLVAPTVLQSPDKQDVLIDRDYPVAEPASMAMVCLAGALLLRRRPSRPAGD